MRGLTPAELLSIWEHAQRESPARRALAILAPVSPGETTAALARLPLGELNRRLLDLREGSFGPRLSVLTRCPGCAADVQADFATGDIRTERRAEPAPKSVVSAAGREIRFRLPDTLALEDAANAPDPAAARERLIARCVVEPGAAARPPFPADLVDAIAAGISAADPQTDVELEFSCPACSHRWAVPFDIAGHFWIELQSCAQRLLHGVHELAAAYGWSEAAILALPPERRSAYLELVRG